MGGVGVLQTSPENWESGTRWSVSTVLKGSGLGTLFMLFKSIESVKYFCLNFKISCLLF